MPGACPRLTGMTGHLPLVMARQDPSNFKSKSPRTCFFHLQLFQLFIHVVQPLHAILKPVVMLHVRHQERKEKHVKRKHRYFRHNHQEKNPANGQKRKQDHHELVHQTLMLKKADVRPHRQELFRRQRRPCRNHFQKFIFVIAQLFQHIHNILKFFKKNELLQNRMLF